VSSGEPTEPILNPILPGAHLGKYEIVHRIAFGGMAEIYLARASGIQGFEKYVVLKRILPQFAANDEFVRMFLQEARVAAALDHANIAHVYDIGEEGGVYFFTMEYLHGEDTRWILKKLARRNLRLPLEHAVAIGIGTAAGLHFAHEKKGSDGRLLGIVHRDTSPSNIVVTYDGGVKLVDFGVAKLAADPELSRRYSLKGKLAYMSPEQLENKPVDRRCDLFSLGTVLFELTTQRRLFKAENEIETMRLVLMSDLPRPSQVLPDYPPELERIVMRALDRDVDRRYATARELQVDLEAFARDARLQVSSSALADWMERSFGPKRELWHMLPRAGTPPPPASLPPSRPPLPSSEVETRVVSNTDGAGRRASRRGGARVAVAFAALAVVAVGGAALAFRRGAAAERVAAGASAAVPPAVVLVAETGSIAIERGAAALPVAASPSDAGAGPGGGAVPAGPALAKQVAEPAEPAPPRRDGRRHLRAAAHGRGAAAAPGESFSATLARHESEIRRCFTELGGDAGRAGEISLRFQTARDGHVKAVDVLPEAAATAPLGACLQRVGRATVFAPQAAPVAFRIPITVHLQRR
jgi:serine/threonine protein kinase